MSCLTANRKSISHETESKLLFFLCVCLFIPALPLCLQYSQKEDKYEEEIKILTDKLKEVSGFSAGTILSKQQLSFFNTNAFVFRRLRLVLSLLKGQ